MSREQSLRQLVYNCNKELLKSEGLTRNELHDLTNWVLNNAAVSKMTPDEVYICEGNYLGIGENNKDREIVLPRFLTYEYGKLDAFSIAAGKSKTFRLKSYRKFEELESFISYSTTCEIVAIVDGEILNYSKYIRQGWGYEVIWNSEVTVYIVNYVLEDKEKKEIIKSKRQFEIRLLELVEQGAEDIQAYNAMEGENLAFTVSKQIYASHKKEEEKERWLTWGKEIEEDEEEEMMF